MKDIVAKGIVKQVFDKVNTKSNGKQFTTAQVEITSAVGKGLIVLANRTLGDQKSEVTEGQEVTLHGHLYNGELRFEIQTGVQATTGADLLKAFGLAKQVQPVSQPATK